MDCLVIRLSPFELWILQFRRIQNIFCGAMITKYLINYAKLEYETNAYDVGTYQELAA